MFDDEQLGIDGAGRYGQQIERAIHMRTLTCAVFNTQANKSACLPNQCSAPTMADMDKHPFELLA